MTSIAQPSDSLQRFQALAAIRVHRGALLVELADVGQPRELDDLIRYVPKLVSA